MLSNARISTESRGERACGEALAQAFAQALGERGAIVEMDPDGVCPQAMVDADSRLLASVAERRGSRDGQANAVLRVWQNHRVLVVPKSFYRREPFASARDRCSVPVVLRQSGGSAVFHGPHILNVSLALAPRPLARFSVAECYNRLAAIILPQLRALRICAELSDVAGAHCPGAYSIVAKGRKLGGTAAFTQRTDAGLAALVHAAISMWPSEGDLEEISRFDRRMGLSPSYNPSAHTSLSEAVQE